MEYIKNRTKILVKDDNGRIVQVIPETEAASVLIGNGTVADRIEELENGKADLSHSHTINDIPTLQSVLDEKNPLIDEISNAEVLALLES